MFCVIVKKPPFSNTQKLLLAVINSFARKQMQSLTRYLSTFSHAARTNKSWMPRVCGLLQNISLDELARKTTATTSSVSTTNHKADLDRIVLWENDIAEVLLIRWPKGYVGRIHNHSAHGCAFRVMQGTLYEYRYTDTHPVKLASTNILAPRTNQTNMIHNDDGLHAISASKTDGAVSLHVYSPPRYKSTANYERSIQ